MPRSPQDNELIRAARREEIFRAAGRVFAKKGFAATKIADIAAEAKLSHGLLYHYFRSKEEVYAELFDEIVARRPALDAITKGAGSPLERLGRLVSFFLEKSAERPELGVLVTQALVGDTLPEAQRENFLQYGRASYERMVSLVREAQRAGEATSEVSAEELGTGIMSMIRGLATMRFVVRSKVEGMPVLPVVSVDTVLRVLTPRRSATPRLAARPRSATPKPSKKRSAKERKRAA
jgi:AcrR family transcriptional regulator